MTDIAIRVENPCAEPGPSMSKLYPGHATWAAPSSATTPPRRAHGPFDTNYTNYTKRKTNSSNSSNSCQKESDNSYNSRNSCQKTSAK
jgi:hypothetical protein